MVTIKHGASFILNGMFIDELPDEPERIISDGRSKWVWRPEDAGIAAN